MWLRMDKASLPVKVREQDKVKFKLQELIKLVVKTKNNTQETKELGITVQIKTARKPCLNSLIMHLPLVEVTADKDN